MNRVAVLIYPDCSLQEITCLTSALAVWYGEGIDYIASEDKKYFSEEGLPVSPTKTVEGTKITDYDCVILPGTVNPLPALYDERLTDFLKSGANSDIIFASISSSPLLLAKAGILRGKKFTAGFFMQMADIFPFVEKQNMTHRGVTVDGNVITAVGMFYRQFAAAVLRKLGYDADDDFMYRRTEDFTEEDLTFYWSEEDYNEFLEELKEYRK